MWDPIGDFHDEIQPMLRFVVSAMVMSFPQKNNNGDDDEKNDDR